METEPQFVFTPRAAEVNADMYINRPALESSLIAALSRTLHVVIHGESGTGKSWLYKKIFTNSNITFRVANLANASRFHSIAAEFSSLLDSNGHSVKKGYEESKNATVSIPCVASGGISHIGKYEIGQKEPFEACLLYLREIAKEDQAVLVFDNLEAIFDDEVLLKELADLIILCDDDRYAKYKVKILIVGVPGKLKEYYQKTPHYSTVSNRLFELPEITRLSDAECSSLVKRGFIDKLEYQVDCIDSIIKHINRVTDRIPQAVHEYCLELANIGKEERKISPELLPFSDKIWLSTGLSGAYAAIEKNMNERDTKAGRRNQVLYALSHVSSEYFKASQIESLIRREFPLSTKDTTLNVPQILSQLSTSGIPIIRLATKGDFYTYSIPRYRMALMVMLKKTDDERVEKIPISDLYY